MGSSAPRASALAFVLTMMLAVPAQAARSVTEPSRFPDGHARTQLPLVGFDFMLVDQAHGQVFVTGTPTGNSSVVVVDFHGAILKTITGLFGASGMALDTRNGTLYVALNTADAIAAIDTETLTEVNRWSLGSEGECPESLALVRGLVYFGTTYVCTAGGIGVLDPATGFVTTFSGGNFPFYAPLLDSSPGAPGLLMATDRGLSPAELYQYKVKPSGGLSFLGSLWYPCGSSYLSDFDIMPDGTDVMTASGSPYYACAFKTRGLTQDGTYPTGPYPNGVEVSPDNRYLAAGINGIYSADLFVFAVGDTTVIASYDFEEISPDVPDLFPRGEAWGRAPGGKRLLFAITNDSYLGTPPVFQVVVPPLG